MIRVLIKSCLTLVKKIIEKTMSDVHIKNNCGLDIDVKKNITGVVIKTKKYNSLSFLLFLEIFLKIPYSTNKPEACTKLPKLSVPQIKPMAIIISPGPDNLS